MLTALGAQEPGTARPAPGAGPRTYQREHFISVGVFGRAGARRLLQRLLPHVHGGQQGRCRLRVPGRLGGVAAARVPAVPRQAVPAAVPALAAAPAPGAAVALHRGPSAPAPQPRRAFNRLRAGLAPPRRRARPSRPDPWLVARPTLEVRGKQLNAPNYLASCLISGTVHVGYFGSFTWACLSLPPKPFPRRAPATFRTLAGIALRGLAARAGLELQSVVCRGHEIMGSENRAGGAGEGCSGPGWCSFSELEEWS